LSSQATFIIFFLTIYDSLLVETLSLYRQKKIKAIEPLKVFDVSEITQAYRFFGLGNRIGKIAISLENANTLIPVSDSMPQPRSA
jgi:hypothetical protein